MEEQGGPRIPSTAAPTRAPRIGQAVRRPELKNLNFVEAGSTLATFALLRQLGAIAATPLWVYCVLLVGGAVSSAVVLRRWPGGCTTRQLHCRVAVNAAVTTAVIYATGWGPTLAIGYVFVLTDN